MIDPINEASIQAFQRYLNIIKESRSKNREKLFSMCEYCIGHPDMPVDKMSRWLGFVQGVLYSEGLIDINRERDFTRPLFHNAYKKLGQEIPERVTV